LLGERAESLSFQLRVIVAVVARAECFHAPMMTRTMMMMMITDLWWRRFYVSIGRPPPWRQQSNAKTGRYEWSGRECARVMKDCHIESLSKATGRHVVIIFKWAVVVVAGAAAVVELSCGACVGGAIRGD
jgi:hypothetical protein